ncbi:RNA polymerase-associated protein RapA [Opitutales bacterium]|nr:RNA polymerase-associated protein RapA [Opitutales bacterium]
MNQYKTGQRWISMSEPELGLGTVVQEANGRVHVLYPATGEMRLYVSELAPLQRVQFRVGQEIEDHEGTKRFIETIREENGVLLYCGEGWQLPEAHLSDSISLNGPEDRLQTGHFDEAFVFGLRLKAIEIMHHLRKSPTRGFLGGRIDLITHQLYIAQEICNRSAPRVLLSDEVGLGKTIEAGLIIHRRRLTGRAERVLIIVPESLVHQWFVEMLRKFNLWMNIFDEERCTAIETSDPKVNPFLDDQLALCSIDFLANNTLRAKQAFEAGWDLMVVDEAHHLEWTLDHVSREYELVEALANKAEGVLLLTATPEQLGPESHFARLRILDPNRYSDLSSFLDENESYADVAPIATALHEGSPLTSDQRSVLASMPDIDAEEMDEITLLSALLDRHGPGRVVFRNTRANMSGFPKRVAYLLPLDPPKEDPPALDDQDELELEDLYYHEEDEEPTETISFIPEPRVLWLEKLLEEIGEDKVLLICESKENAKAIEQAIAQRITVKSTVFHEELTLVQRDRNAAWFEEKDGARILICSEIGSEGRNFQFSHHLVLFDLPVDPELLAQRIGRLDRIGQTQTIHIYVPYTKNGREEVLARWYHDGLDAFENHLEGGNLVLRQFGEEVGELLETFNESVEEEHKLAKMIAKSSQQRKIIAEQLEKGRDRLLELNSNRPEVADALVDSIRDTDSSLELETFLLEVFDHFGVRVEERDNRTYLLDGRAAINCDGFPGLPKGGLVGTFDRSFSLSREDITLLTGDHPIVTGAVDLLLGSEQGNCSFSVWEDDKEEQSLLLEAIFVLEALAPKQLHADRFLPPTPLRFLINQDREVVTMDLPEMIDGSPYALLDDFKVGKELIPKMLGKARKMATAMAKNSIKEATESMTTTIQGELDRLTALRKINDNIRQEEIDLTCKQMQELAEALSKARIRLDAIRLIFKGPQENEYTDSEE